MGCNDKRYTCGSQHQALCVIYNGYLPEGSELKACKCDISVEEVIEDLYKIADTIKEEIDLTGLSNCLDYGAVVPTRPTVKEAITKHGEEICDLIDAVDALDGNPNVDITNWGLDTECLTDTCDPAFTELKSVIQAIITKLCACNCA